MRFTLFKNNVFQLNLNEARIIALAAAFLVVHPHGVTSDCILNYLKSVIEPCRSTSDDITEILRKYPNLFSHDVINTEPTTDVKTKWKFCGFAMDQIEENPK